MAFDAHKNMAVSTVATAPSPATSGVSLVVAAGEGARFPAVPFNATIWPANTSPTPANSEIVRVTAISTDTFTITRAEETAAGGPSARSIIVGDQIAATITAKTLTDVEAASQFVEQTTSATGQQDNFSLNGPKTILYCTGDAPNFTGFTVVGSTPKNGDEVMAYQASGTSLKFTNDATSTAANRLYTDSTTGQIVGLRGVIRAVYSETAGRWIQTAAMPGKPLDYASVSTVVGFSSFTSGRKQLFYQQLGRKVYAGFLFEGTSNSSALSFTLPFTAANLDGGGLLEYGSTGASVQDSGSTLTVATRIRLDGNTNTVYMYINMGTGSWTASGTKSARGSFWADIP